MEKNIAEIMSAGFTDFLSPKVANPFSLINKIFNKYKLLTRLDRALYVFGTGIELTIPCFETGLII